MVLHLGITTDSFQSDVHILAQSQKRVILMMIQSNSSSLLLQLPPLQTQLEIILHHQIVMTIQPLPHPRSSLLQESRIDPQIQIQLPLQPQLPITLLNFLNQPLLLQRKDLNWFIINYFQPIHVQFVSVHLHLQSPLLADMSFVEIVFIKQ